MNSKSSPPPSFSKPLYPWELCNKKWLYLNPLPLEVNRVKTVVWKVIPNPSLKELETFFTE